MPLSILDYFYCYHVTDKKQKTKPISENVKALVLIEPGTCFPRLFFHRIHWLNNITFVLTVRVSKDKFSSDCFRCTTRSNCHPSSSSCLCPRHSIGSGRRCGLALWGWSCHCQWNRCWRCQTHGRDCHCGNCAQCTPPSESTLEVTGWQLGSI